METIYLITTAGPNDWTLFFNGQGWSNERPDAKEYRFKSEARLELIALQRRGRDRNAGISEDTDD